MLCNQSSFLPLLLSVHLARWADGQPDGAASWVLRVMMLIAAQVMVWAAAGVDSAAVSSLTADSGTSASIHAATECSTAALSNLITARMKRQWRRSGNSGIGWRGRSQSECAGARYVRGRGSG